MEDFKDIILGITIDEPEHVSDVEIILLDAGYSRMKNACCLEVASIVAYPIDQSISGFEELEYGKYMTPEPMCEQTISSTNFIEKYGTSISKSN